jgi:hypothetical protein
MEGAVNGTTRASLTLAVFVVAAVVSLGAAATAFAASAPSIESESVSNITATDATIEAQINTGGLETTYEAWVGTYPECIEASEWAIEHCESTAGHPIVGTIAGSSSPSSISVDITKAWHELNPSTSYIYHVRATNSDWAHATYGENKVFETAAALPPSIESESVSHITTTDATLEAQINTEGLETTYEFLLQPPEPACLEAEPPCMIPQHEPIRLEGGHLFGSFVGQSVSVELNSAGVSLAPGATYKYWVSATNAADTATGQRQSFTTPFEPGVEPLTEPSGGTDPQTPTTIQSPTSTSSSHHRRHRHHRWHKRGLQRSKLHRASHAG